ncbi:FecR domain-containing protein [Pseudomonas entomophila]|uniref:FecR domain-containing protein n=1 Tax=Pseudomonas entomophila TaxID=312306 RepID=UPI00200CF4DA|nr:FecR family protein [Pseudomonas entomophila]
MTDTSPIARPVLAQAASWLLLMQEGPLTAEQQARLLHWRQSNPEHERAWSRAQRLLDRLGTLPPTLARQSLTRPTRHDRRTVLRGLLLMIGAAPLGWWAWRRGAPDNYYQTAVGERRDVHLADGGSVSLNSDTAMDVRFTKDLRLLQLQRGELYIVTASDPQVPVRPFKVQTGQGILRALGTRFSVRQLPGETLLAVYEGAVQVAPHETIVRAGQQVRFSHDRPGPIEATSEALIAWRNGLLLADDMPLAQWAQEMMRYTTRPLACDPGVETLRVSGTFPVDDLPLALAMLTQTYGLRVYDDNTQVAISR